MRRGDDRAVTVQIGAVLLLAILFAALALYQINVVPAANEDVEIDHNRAVHDEFQELRNGIQNAGIVGTPRATSVTLGTRYPTRTVTTNPPSPTGTLETTGERPIRLENARAESGNDDLIGSHTTTTLVYEPDYNEYRSAPTTRIEHAVAFNDFGDAAVQLPGPNQQLVDGDRNRLTIVLLVGSLSETTTGAVSVDAESLDGEPGTATIAPDDPAAPIELTIPTASPDFWNETLEGEPETTPAAYDEDSNQLTVHLEDDEYTLRMSTVGIGEYDATAGFDFTDGNRDGEQVSDAYTTRWTDPSGQSGVDDSRCSAESCVVTGESVELTMETDGVAADASIDYAVSDPTVGTVSSTAGTTDDGGTHSTTFDVASDASDGDTVDVYATSGSDGDAIQLEISRGLEITTVDVTDNSDESTGKAAFDVAYAVEDTDGSFEEFDRVEIEFENVGTGESWTDASTDTSGTFTYERDGAYGDTYRITLQVYETDGSLADEATETLVADGGTYEINSVSLAAGSGNDIDVTVDLETTDSNAELVVRSLQSNGNERDRVTVVAADGTYTVSGANQADEVQVILRDGDGVDQESQTELWNG